MWYVALDPIKWAMAYILDEEGIRTGKRSADSSSYMQATSPLNRAVCGPVSLSITLHPVL